MTQQKERIKYAHIKGEGPNWFYIDFRFDPLLIQEIKDTAGMGNYQWNDRKKRWYIRRAYLEAMVELFKSRGYKVYTNISTEQDAYKAGQERAHREDESRRRRRETHHDRQEQERKQTQEDVWDSFFGTGRSQQRGVEPGKFTQVQLSWLTVFSELDHDVAGKLFRHATLALHPDVGGNEEAFKSLNSAWQEYNK